jgi:hypothetical protein
MTIKQIVADISGSFKAVSDSGIAHGVTPLTVYQALDGVLKQLLTDPNLPQDKLVLVSSLVDAVQAAIAADKDAQTMVDPDKLKSIDPLP